MGLQTPADRAAAREHRELDQDGADLLQGALDRLRPAPIAQPRGLLLNLIGSGRNIHFHSAGDLLTFKYPGFQDLWGLQSKLGVAVGCGACKEMASEILSECRQAKPQFEPVRYQPSAA